MRRITALLATGAVALGGAGLVGCGDDSEGPAEDAGKAIDEAGSDVVNELEEEGKEAEKELDDEKKEKD